MQHYFFLYLKISLFLYLHGQTKEMNFCKAIIFFEDVNFEIHIFLTERIIKIPINDKFWSIVLFLGRNLT